MQGSFRPAPRTPRRAAGSLHRHSNSLVFELELESDDEVKRLRAATALPVEYQATLGRIQRELKEVWRVAEMAKDKCRDPVTGEVDLARFAGMLARRGFRVWLRCSAQRGPWSGTKRRYTFCVVELPDGQLVIADPNFWDQFSLATAHSTYSSLLALMPPVFVGTAEHLIAVVTLLCKEMAEVFEHKGVPCPPWRTKKAMLARWLVSSANDVLVD